MAAETINGVKNRYGPRTRHEGVAGTLSTRDDERALVIWFDGSDYDLVTHTLPAGAVMSENAIVEVTQAFVLGGTTPVINIGVSGTEGTNRIAQVSEAQAEAVGTYSIATAGTLAKDTPLAAAATIAVALGGTSPTITAAGKMKVVVRYRVI
jgi:hypothetical protein